MKIIAEVGSNWSSLEDCKKSIQLAKACGADAVKFQLFNFESLYGPLGNWQQGHNKDLPVDWLTALKEKADAFGIEFMCSAFSPELIDAVDPFVKIHKVASAELTHVRMLEKLRAIGKPVILSTGASGDADIANALRILMGVDVTLMYCVSEYPARMIDMSQISLMQNRFHRQVGFSDHTIDVFNIPTSAKGQAARYLEKHVNFVGATGPDADYALTEDEFKAMCDWLKHGKMTPPSEKAMRTRHNRRLIAIKDISPGDELREGLNFGIYRSLKDDTQALTPWAVDQVNGKPAIKSVKAGDGIGIDVVKL